MDVIDELQDHFMTANDVARICNLQTRTVINWRYKEVNPGPPYVRFGKNVRYRASAVAKWMRELQSNSKQTL